MPRRPQRQASLIQGRIQSMLVIKHACNEARYPLHACNEAGYLYMRPAS